MRDISITINFQIEDEDFNDVDFQDNVVNPIAGDEFEEKWIEEYESIRNFESKIEVK